jgi:tetratricopeptide (TPR) repeat protein
MAKAVYDPQADTNAPAAVLNQLGNHSLLNKEFSGAIRYYERAREKSPDDPAVLNNLAFSYLVAPQDERNAARALQLINAAIRNLPKDIDPVELSKFFHTKATALKQLERLQEAIAIYEKSLKERRDHPDTLRSLIECYRGLNMVAPEQYISRLKKIEEQSPQKE